MSDKPFAPTAQRLRRAREQGDFAKAGEIATLVSFGVAAWALRSALPTFGQAVQTLFMLAITRMRLSHGRESAASFALSGLPAMHAIFIAVLGVLASGGAAACALSLAVTRGELTAISCKPSRLAPLPALKQMFGPETLTALLRASLAASAAFAVLMPVLAATVQATAALRDPRGLAALAWDQINTIVAALAGVGLVFAFVETAGNRRRRTKKLRMSHDEMRREWKDQSGDPHQRSARKRRHRSMMRGGTRAVKTATVVITNPTHIAIALRYDPPAVGVPLVVARAADELAAAVREEAHRSGVPLVENVELARFLHARCTEGDPIPLESYAAVATIIAALTSPGEQERKSAIHTE